MFWTVIRSSGSHTLYWCNGFVVICFIHIKNVAVQLKIWVFELILENDSLFIFMKYKYCSKYIGFIWKLRCPAMHGYFARTEWLSSIVIFVACFIKVIWNPPCFYELDCFEFSGEIWNVHFTSVRNNEMSQVEIHAHRKQWYPYCKQATFFKQATTWQ